MAHALNRRHVQGNAITILRECATHRPLRFLGAILSIGALLMLAIGVLGDQIGVAREVSHRALVDVQIMGAQAGPSTSGCVHHRRLQSPRKRT